MEKMVDTIVNREESSFGQILIQRLKLKVIPKLTADIEKTFQDNVMTNIQQQQYVNEGYDRLS